MKQKNIFLKSDFDEGNFFFVIKKKMPNTLEYAQVLLVTWVKLDSVNALFSFEFSAGGHFTES